VKKIDARRSFLYSPFLHQNLQQLLLKKKSLDEKSEEYIRFVLTDEQNVLQASFFLSLLQIFPFI
jgi:hypothetical protein